MERESHNHVRPYHVKAGHSTTEFFLALGVVVIATAVVAIHLRSGGLDVVSGVAIAAAALTSIGYSHSRSIAKSGR